MKIMADMDDVQYINAAGELGYLSIQTPNGELKELVEQYHQLNRLTYHKNGVPEREDYRAFWESLASTHYDKSVFDEIFTKLDDYLKNEEINNINKLIVFQAISQKVSFVKIVRE